MDFDPLEHRVCNSYPEFTGKVEENYWFPLYKSITKGSLCLSMEKRGEIVEEL